MSDDTATLAARLKTQLQNCEGFDGDATSDARKQALDYYFQRPRGDEVVGRAAVVSGDVSAMVEAVAAQMLESFSGTRICDFDPLGPEDEDQAQLESEAVQYFVMGRENGFLELQSAVKDALLVRNGVIKVEAQERTVRTTRRYRNVAPAALPDLIDGATRHVYDEAARELAVTRDVERLEFSVESVPMENFLYASDWNKPTLGGIPVCAIRHRDSRAELIALGYPAALVNGLPEHRQNLTAESAARNPRSSSHKATAAVDSSQEQVEWYEVYIRLDSGDGIDELHRIAMSYEDAVILKEEAIPFMRLAAGTTMLNPHRFTGISLFDKLKQIQDMRTGLRRALLDNVQATTKNRLAGLDGVVNTDDVADGRVNNLVRVKNTVQDVRQAIMALVVPDTSANILANLESTGRERAEMGGAALDLQTAQMQIGGDRMGSQGLDRAYSVAEQLAAAMTKTIAATLIRDVFLIAHATLREHFDKPVPYKVRGKWRAVNPSEWPERLSATVKPGMSPGERARRLAAVGEVINSQLMLVDKGMEGVLVDLPGFNRALLDWARLAEVQNPEQYFVDPESPGAQAALQDKQQQAQQADMQKKTLMQQAFGLEQLRIAFEKYRTDADRQFSYYDAVLKSEIEEAKIVGAATAQLAARQEHGNGKTRGETGSAGAVAEQAAPEDS